MKQTILIIGLCLLLTGCISVGEPFSLSCYKMHDNNSVCEVTSPEKWSSETNIPSRLICSSSHTPSSCFAQIREQANCESVTVSDIYNGIHITMRCSKIIE